MSIDRPGGLRLGANETRAAVCLVGLGLDRTIGNTARSAGDRWQQRAHKGEMRDTVFKVAPNLVQPSVACSTSCTEYRHAHIEICTLRAKAHQAEAGNASSNMLRLGADRLSRASRQVDYKFELC